MSRSIFVLVDDREYASAAATRMRIRSATSATTPKRFSAEATPRSWTWDTIGAIDPPPQQNTSADPLQNCGVSYEANQINAVLSHSQGHNRIAKRSILSAQSLQCEVARRVRLGRHPSITVILVLPPDQKLNGLSYGAIHRGLEMSERGEVGERLATMLQHAAETAEGQTEVKPRNPQDEATKAQREAIEVQRKAAEAETKAAEASIASAKATEKAAVAMERNAKYMFWSVIVASVSAIASALSAYYSYWSAVHPR